MRTYIALFKGINVGGNNILPMKELITLMGKCGYENIRTYIQSGNVIFDSKKKPTTKIANLINDTFGFRPEVFLLSANDIQQALNNNPYDFAEGKFCHFYFCKDTPTNINTEKLLALKAHSEEYTVKDKVFYLYTPDGMARSKLAANIERCLSVVTTARNLNTVNKLSSMLQQ